MAPKPFRQSVLSTIVLLILSYTNGDDKNNDLRFPPGFLFGASTSSYQIEGAWNISDKGVNAWDHYTHHQPDKIHDNSNGDVACDSYNKYDVDAEAVKHIGLNYYRFSLSWSRILPKGFSHVVSQDGINYYHNLISELEKRNITPIVTLYHWDHPQIFQEMGGWMNELMVEQFADYARVVFKEFGHRVKTWITINEPNAVCTYAYVYGLMPPGLKLGSYAAYHCNQNVLKAHARVYHIYKDEFKAKQKGKVGITLELRNYFAKHKNDAESPEIGFQFQFGIYAHPIYSKTGDWPELVKNRVARLSEEEGLPRSRLPEFSKSWIEYIRGSADFLGLNHYTSMLVELAGPNVSIHTDDGLSASYDPKWPSTAYGWMKIVPHGFLNALRKIKKEYDNPLVYVTENGVPDHGVLEDNVRLQYLHGYMKNMLIAINKYNCNVESYSIWSLLDNFEWYKGYARKFGLYQVDFESSDKTRTMKKSACWLKDVIKAKKLLPIDYYLVPNISVPFICDETLENCDIGSIQLAPPIVDIFYRE